MFQIKCLIYGDTTTKSLRGKKLIIIIKKRNKKVKYNITGWKGKIKPETAPTLVFRTQ